VAEGEGFEPPKGLAAPVDFKFSNREAPSDTIGHHWQQSQALPELSVQRFVPVGGR